MRDAATAATRKKAYEEIAAALCERNSQITAVDVERQWKNLKVRLHSPSTIVLCASNLQDTYQKVLKKRPHVSDGTPHASPRWRFFRALTFIDQDEAIARKFDLRREMAAVRREHEIRTSPSLPSTVATRQQQQQQRQSVATTPTAVFINLANVNSGDSDGASGVGGCMLTPDVATTTTAMTTTAAATMMQRPSLRTTPQMSVGVAGVIQTSAAAAAAAAATVTKPTASLTRLKRGHDSGDLLYVRHTPIAPPSQPPPSTHYAAASAAAAAAAAVAPTASLLTTIGNSSIIRSAKHDTLTPTSATTPFGCSSSSPIDDEYLSFCKSRATHHTIARMLPKFDLGLSLVHSLKAIGQYDKFEFYKIQKTFRDTIFDAQTRIHSTTLAAVADSAAIAAVASAGAIVNDNGEPR